MAPFPAYWCNCSANGGNPHLINARVKEIDNEEVKGAEGIIVKKMRVGRVLFLSMLLQE